MTMIEAFYEAMKNNHRCPVVVPPNCTARHGYTINFRGDIYHHVPGCNNMPSLQDLQDDRWTVVYDSE